MPVILLRTSTVSIASAVDWPVLSVVAAHLPTSHTDSSTALGKSRTIELCFSV